MQTLWQDLRYALRQLRNAPGFTVTAIVTLALGIGVTTTVFSVARQVLLTPLPYAQPERLVGVSFDLPGNPPNAEQTGASAVFLMRNSHSFQSAALMDGGSITANLSSRDGHASSIDVLGVSQGYFSTLGVGPALGRAFTEEEDRPGAPQALVLSYGLWQRAFGGDPSVVGRTLRLNQQNITVVGVMPAGFRAETSRMDDTLVAPDAWRALQAGPKDPGYDGTNYQMFARLRQGVTLAQAEAEIQTLQPAFLKENPSYKRWKDEAGRPPVMRMWPLATVVAGNVHDSLLMMTAATVAVLLLTCLNLAGLNTARALRRGPEFALRFALGASRGRLLRLALLETAVLAACGIAGAIVASRLLLPFLLRNSPVAIPQLNGAAGLFAVAAQTTALGLLSAILFGAPLAVVALRRRGSHALGNARAAGGTRRQASAGKLLIVLQMSLAVVLISAASLLLGSFLKLRAQPLGFQPQKLVVFQTNLKGDRYAPTAVTNSFVNQVLASLRQSPGVQSAAAVSGLPLDRGLNEGGWPDSRSQLRRNVEFRAVTPSYFQTMALPLLQGRDILASDGPGAMPVAIVSAATARTWWPGRSPIGSEIHTDAKTAFRIVGIAAGVPGRTLSDEPGILVYAPIAQLPDETTKMLNGWFPLTFSVRLAAHIDAAPIVRSAVTAADAEIPVAKLATMQQVIDSSVAGPRFFTQLAEAFAGFAVLLTAIGIFGLLSYQVTQRTREIGVRMALGASRGTILRGVLLASGSLALIGGGLGLAGGALLQPLLTRWVALNVVGVDPGDHRYLFNSTAALCLAAVLLAAVTLLAALLPARKAARVEPIEALRSE